MPKYRANVTLFLRNRKFYEGRVKGWFETIIEADNEELVIEHIENIDFYNENITLREGDIDDCGDYEVYEIILDELL